MQMVRWMGTSTFVYPSGTVIVSLFTSAKWSCRPTSTSRTSAESRTLNPVAYFTVTTASESAFSPSAPCPFPPFPVQAQRITSAAIPYNNRLFFIAISDDFLPNHSLLFSFCLQRYKIVIKQANDFSTTHIIQSKKEDRQLSSSVSPLTL